MVIFGSIGLFRRWIPISSQLLAFTRGLIGALFLLLVSGLKKRPTKRPGEASPAQVSGKAAAPSAAPQSDSSLEPALTPLKKLLWFGIPGALIGFNWVLLFEAYRYTTVSIATLCYYMSPALVILLSPLLLKEKLTLKKGLCVLAALVGMVLISGLIGSGTTASLAGVLLGLGAAVLYASVILINKKAPATDVYEKTTIQLGMAALCLVPYLLISGSFTFSGLTLPGVILLLIVGIVHTGLAYALYFASIRSLKAQTVALLSYLDPVVALLLSVLILGESMTPLSILGAVLILGSALIAEI